MDMIQEAMELAKAVFAGDSGGHDLDHTLRVYRMARHIAQAEGADPEVVSLAALLHDVDDHKLSPETCAGKTRAADFLHRQNLDEERIREILTIIERISYSANAGAQETLEGKCVQDADRLDALGAIGIARTFAYGGSKGRRIHDPAGEDKTTSVQHFYDKLLRLADLMTTSTGRELAHRRHIFMEEFLARCYGEWAGEI